MPRSAPIDLDHTIGSRHPEREAREIDLVDRLRGWAGFWRGAVEASTLIDRAHDPAPGERRPQ